MSAVINTEAVLIQCHNLLPDGAGFLTNPVAFFFDHLEKVKKLWYGKTVLTLLMYTHQGAGVLTF